jgi:anti-sigma factor RsiW
MTCREFADFIDDYLTGALPPNVLAAFEAHIAVCANCVRYLAQYRDSMAVGRMAFTALDSELTGDVPEDLIAAILAARPSP